MGGYGAGTVDLTTLHTIMSAIQEGHEAWVMGLVTLTYIVALLAALVYFWRHRQEIGTVWKIVCRSDRDCAARLRVL
jgi:hypothetical protein